MSKIKVKEIKVKVVGNKVLSSVGTIATFDTEAGAQDYANMVEEIESQLKANREFKKAMGW